MRLLVVSRSAPESSRRCSPSSRVAPQPPGPDCRCRRHRYRSRLSCPGNYSDLRCAVGFTSPPIRCARLCADLTCTAPSPGELGDAIGAQNAAANLDVNALTLNIGGGGSVSSSDKVFSCGAKCYGVYNPGNCRDTLGQGQLGQHLHGLERRMHRQCHELHRHAQCRVSGHGHLHECGSWWGRGRGRRWWGGGGGGVSGFKLSVAKSNSGTVTSTPAGINCGNTCTSNYAAGNAVSLTATPPPGLAFLAGAARAAAWQRAAR